MVWLLQPCNQASLSLLCFLQALTARAQQKPPREQQHSGLYNVPLLPPQLHKFSSLTDSFLPMFLFIFPLFFCAAYSFIFISRCNLLSPSSMLYVPAKGAVHTQQSLQFLKSNRTCSWGWIFLASKCSWFTLGVQGAHDWVHYKLVIMSLMSQMPWEYFRSQDWAWCLSRKRNAFITCTAIGLLLRMGDAEPERAACLKLHSKYQERSGTLTPHGRTGQTEAGGGVNCSSKLVTACGLKE